MSQSVASISYPSHCADRGPGALVLQAGRHAYRHCSFSRVMRHTPCLRVLADLCPSRPAPLSGSSLALPQQRNFYPGHPTPPHHTSHPHPHYTLRVHTHSRAADGTWCEVRPAAAGLPGASWLGPGPQPQHTRQAGGAGRLCPAAAADTPVGAIHGGCAAAAGRQPAAAARECDAAGGAPAGMGHASTAAGVCVCVCVVCVCVCVLLVCIRLCRMQHTLCSSSTDTCKISSTWC